ncbi:hypothetical protein BCR39DRAFT_271553 [Naematelia encephala]|uniref:Uncharacterized protein n=1 Tax=Naematelia encephala TaxID=71784 RepID=A0A1Y2AUC2_9TREE|nr:hypothetical protein BCR39DRAFT_271553 [Naematelia encephala]
MSHLSSLLCLRHRAARVDLFPFPRLLFLISLLCSLILSLTRFEKKTFFGSHEYAAWETGNSMAQVTKRRGKGKKERAGERERKKERRGGRVSRDKKTNMVIISLDTLEFQARTLGRSSFVILGHEEEGLVLY